MTVSERSPRYELAHLGHTELLTPDLDASATFFTEVYGLTCVGEDRDRVHLRGVSDEVLSSLTLTAAPKPGLGHVAWRADSSEALQRRVAALQTRGIEGTWGEDFGHGPAFRFTAVGGHQMEIYFETERFVPSPGKEPALPNQPERFLPRGAAAARIDHINLLVPNVRESTAFQRDVLGFQLRERLVPTPENEVGAWLSLMTKAHDLALTQEPAPTQGRLHHLAYAVESRADVLTAADVFLDAGTPIEFGPAKHARTQGFFLYVIEPGGNRVEVFAGGIHIFSPDFDTVTWTSESGGRSTAWGLDVPPSFHSYATPQWSDLPQSRSDEATTE